MHLVTGKSLLRGRRDIGQLRHARHGCYLESIEIDNPVRIVHYELVPDSGGSGKFRGGLGQLREYEMLAESASVNVRGDRAAFPPLGLYHGGNGSFNTFNPLT